MTSIHPPKLPNSRIFTDSNLHSKDTEAIFCGMYAHALAEMPTTRASIYHHPQLGLNQTCPAPPFLRTMPPQQGGQMGAWLHYFCGQCLYSKGGTWNKQTFTTSNS